MRLGAALYYSPTGPLLLNLSRAQGVRFSTNERGFASFSCFVPLSLLDSFFVYDRPTLPHIAVTWAGGVVWEGMLEDVAIVDGGLRLTALGYIRGYAAAPYSTSHIGVTASTIVQALIAAANALNSFMSSSTMLVQDPGVTLAEIYEDQYPVDILDRLCNLGDSQTTPRLWEAGVWENRILHFRPRGDAARKWAVDVAAADIERTLETLYNSVYAVYQDGGNQRAVTATSSDSTSIARYGLTRRAAVSLQAIDSTLAGKVRDAYLSDHKDPPVRAGVGFRRLYDQFGTLWPAYAARSGDQVTIRNLPPTATSDIDRIRTFRLKETDYDADIDWMSAVPESLRASIAPQSNASRLASITDPNLQYQPRPTLAELYADFKGLPGLRGLWFPGSVDNAGTMYDQSGQGRTLTYNGNPTLNVYGGFIPYYDLDGTGDYFSRADEAGLDITGTETTIASAQRGLTLGGWMRFDGAGAAEENFLTKRSAGAGNLSYYLRRTSTGLMNFEISTDGTAVKNVSGASVGAGSWAFVVGRFTPSAALDIWVNGVKATNTTSIPASIFSGSGALNLGAYAGGSQVMTGDIALAFLCAALLSDTQIAHLFARTRKFFGV